MVCALFGKSYHQIEESMCQTIGQIESLHHFTICFRKYCHVGTSATECTWVLLQDAGFAGNLNGMFDIFRKPHICSGKLDLQEANSCVTQ